MGISFVSAGALIFSREKTKKEAEIKPDESKPMVDFDETKKQMQHYQAELMKEYKPKRKIRFSKDENLDDEIRKKRELLKFKKLNTIFEEFAEDRNTTQSYYEPTVESKLNGTIFSRLDEIHKSNPFLKLDLVNRDEEKKLKRKTQTEDDKLDKLIKKDAKHEKKEAK